MSEFEAYQAKLLEYPHAQHRLEFKQGQMIETNWELTGDDEVPYRFIAGATFDYRGQFLKRLYEPV